MNRKDNTRKPTKESIPSSALLVFADGFNAMPIIVPNGGSEELDATIMRWLERKLVSQHRQGSKKSSVSVKIMSRVWESSSASGGGQLRIYPIVDNDERRVLDALRFIREDFEQ